MRSTFFTPSQTRDLGSGLSSLVDLSSLPAFADMVYGLEARRLVTWLAKHVRCGRAHRTSGLANAQLDVVIVCEGFVGLYEVVAKSAAGAGGFGQ